MVAVALAPGLVAEVGVLEASRVDPGQVVALAAQAGCLALDGEYEVEPGPADRVTVRLVPGPFVAPDKLSNRLRPLTHQSEAII